MSLGRLAEVLPKRTGHTIQKQNAKTSEKALLLPRLSAQNHARPPSVLTACFTALGPSGTNANVKAARILGTQIFAPNNSQALLAEPGYVNGRRPSDHYFRTFFGVFCGP